MLGSDFKVEVIAYEKSDFQDIYTEASGNLTLDIINSINQDNEYPPESQNFYSGIAIFKSVKIDIIGNFIVIIKSNGYHTVNLLITIYGFLKVTFPNTFVSYIQPMDYMEAFDVLVEIFSDEALTKKYSLSNISITLKTVPYTKILGLINKIAYNGEALFTGVLIEKEGYYNMLAVSSASKTGISKLFNISETQTVYSIKLETENLYVESEKEFTIKVSLHTMDGNYFPHIAAVWLESSLLFFEGEYIKQIENSNGTFTIKLLRTGPTEINAYSNKDNQNIKAQSLILEARKPYCNSFRRYLCDGCTNNAIIENNICKCIPLAIFDPENNLCYCTANSIFNSDKTACICQEINGELSDNSFSREDISAYFCKDFRCITIIFNTHVSEAPNKNCLDVISFSDSVSKKVDSCYWSRNDTIIVNSISFFNHQSIEVSILKSLTPKVPQCRKKSSDLSITVKYIYTPLIPVVRIEYPDVVSLSCSTGSLLLQAKPYSDDYIYTWNEPKSFSKIVSYDSDEDGNMEIEYNSLEPGTLQIGVVVEDNFFETSCNDTVNIKIIEEPALNIELNVIPYFTIKRNEALTVKPYLAGACNLQGTFEFEWSQLDGPWLDFDALLAKRPRDDVLHFPKFTFEAGYQYKFQSLIRHIYSNTNGTKEFIINVQASDLEMKFNSWNETIGLDDSLTIIADVYDPDDYHAEVEYIWTCLDGYRECKDSKNIRLINNPYNQELVIYRNKLVEGKDYTFVCTAEVNGKMIMGFIEKKIRSGYISILQSEPLHGLQGNQHQINSYPSASIHESNQYKWIIMPSLSSECESNFENLVLNIPRGCLIYGTSYKLSLKVFIDYEIKAEISTTIYRSHLPFCESFKISGIEDGKWFFNVSECFSEVDTLFFQYGIENTKNKIQWLSSEIYSDHYITLPFVNSINGVVRICNSFECSIQKYAIIQILRRRLQDDEYYENNIPEEFVSRFLYNIDNIKSSNNSLILQEIFS